MTEAPKLAQTGQSLTVLFVEDSPKDIKLMTAALERSGYRLSFDSVDLLALFEEQLKRSDPEIIISDYSLQDWTAIDALAALKKSGKDIPFIVVSGYLGDEAAVELIKLGATDCILKDRMARLPFAVQRALEGKRSRDERSQAAEAFAVERALEGKRSCDERNQAAEALKHSESRYRNLLDNATCGICLVDPNGRLIEVNQALVEMLGCGTESEVLNLDIYRCPQDRDRFLEAARRTEVFSSLEIELRRKDGKAITVRLSGRSVRDEQDETHAFEVILENITDRQHMERQIQQLQRFEAIGKLAGGVAHDFNNLLTIILGYNEQLIQRLESGDPLRKSAAMIRDAALRAASLTRQLLAFSRQQILEPRVLDLNQSVSELGKMLRRVLGEDIEVISRLEPNLDHVKADPSQIDQVLMNLVVNARDAMPRGGRLLIETSNVELDEAYAVYNPLVKSGHYVMLAVSDTGIGMDREIQAHIFEPFFTTKEKGKGTGLGLATAYGVVKQSGGSIWVYSEPGQGSTFKIYLPRLEAEVDSLIVDQPLPAAVKGTETVLAVEDEVLLRKIVCEFLKEDGYIVLEANNGADAIEIAQHHYGPIHLLLTDAIMPGMGGRELSERLQCLRPEVRVLFVSGYTDDAILRHGLLEPGTAFLQKPFTKEALARKVREVLDAGKENGSLGAIPRRPAVATNPLHASPKGGRLHPGEQHVETRWYPSNGSGG